ncbi:MAG: hypothetical protein WA626_18355, partial [Acidobacteriaceae bacterium]
MNTLTSMEAASPYGTAYMDANVSQNVQADVARFVRRSKNSLPVRVVEDVSVHIRPEFLDEVGPAIEADL